MFYGIDFVSKLVKIKALYLGVVAMNVTQADYIDALVERKRAEDPLVEAFAARWNDQGEPFFVKNLENVQGDERDDIFGVYNRKLELIAMAHLAHSVDGSFDACGEFGVSVSKSARGRGFGGKLFERAVMHARNEGVQLMFIHALTENTAMLKIARKAGATVEKEGPESKAYLRLPPATFDTRMTEMIEEQIAKTDYRLKVQARQFWNFLAQLQEVRRGVQDSRHKSGA